MGKIPESLQRLCAMFRVYLLMVNYAVISNNSIVRAVCTENLPFMVQASLWLTGYIVNGVTAPDFTFLAINMYMREVVFLEWDIVMAFFCFPVVSQPKVISDFATTTNIAIASTKTADTGHTPKTAQTVAIAPSNTNAMERRRIVKNFVIFVQSFVCCDE